LDNGYPSTATANILLGAGRIYRLSYELQSLMWWKNTWAAHVTTLDGSALTLGVDGVTDLTPANYALRIFTVTIPPGTSAIQLTFTSQGVSDQFRGKGP
jgi:hypothetical protein